MSIRERLEAELVNHGLWPEEATETLNKAEVAKENEAMKGRWNEDVTGYPPQLMSVLWLSIKTTAKEWLKAEKPNHFALAMLN